MSDMNNDQMEAFFDQTITLTLDDDSEIECAVIAIFPMDDKQYMALIPLEENKEAGISTDEVFIYIYTPSDEESDDVDLQVIENDEEYEKVAQAFEALMEEFDDEEVEE